MAKPYKLNTRQLFEISKLIRTREYKMKDIAEFYGIGYRFISWYFKSNGDLTDKSINLIKKELLKQI
jgi:hypothetical protein